MSAVIMFCRLRLLYIERRFCHLYHPRIIHLCNVKEVSPWKRMMLKFGTGGQVVPLCFDLWPREKCPKDFNFSPKVTL